MATTSNTRAIFKRKFYNEHNTLPPHLAAVKLWLETIADSTPKAPAPKRNLLKR